MGKQVLVFCASNTMTVSSKRQKPKFRASLEEERKERKKKDEVFGGADSVVL